MAIQFLNTVQVDTDVLYVDTANDKVGIGTTSPYQKLGVTGNVQIGSQGANVGFNIFSGTNVGLWNYENGYLRFGTNSAERMRIDSTGNVGIGTTSPDVKLEVVEASPTDGIVADFVNSTNAGGTIAAIKLSNADSDVCDVVLGANRVGANFGSDFFISPSDGVDGTNQERLRITEAGAIKFNAYNSTNNTGTPTYLLGTDASGNIVKTNTVPGSGAGPYLPLAGGTMTGDLRLNDNVELELGSDADIRMYHDNSNGYINSFKGDLYIRTFDDDKDIIFQSDNGSGGVTSYLVLDGSTTHAYFSNPGNVGIGTTSPQSKLQVAAPGAGEFAGANSSAAGGSHLMLKDEGSTSRTLMSGPSVVFQTPANSDGSNIWATSRILGSPAAAGSARGTFSIQVRDQYDPFNDGTSWNWRTCLTAINTGNIGIGTNSPSQKLHVNGNARVTGAYYDSGNTPGTANQLLASTATGTAWIDPSTIVAEAATLVVIACKNTSGAAIAQGTPVYQTGTVGATATIEIAPADALISANKLPAIGLLQTALNNNGFGNVVITGELTNFTTDPIDGLTPTVGDKIFVKSGGGLTLTKPTGEGNGIQNMGLVGKVSGGNAGSITVSSIMRTNDVPNLPEGRIWIGDGNTIVSDTVYVDEPNNTVGIGTTSPSARLDVVASGIGAEITSGQSKALILRGGVNSQNIQEWTTTSSSVLAVVNSNGYFGIGTTSPDSKLNIEGPKNTAILTLGNTTSGSTWVVGDRVGGIDFYSADGSGGGIGVKASISYEDAVGGTGSSQAMVFRTGGNTSGTNNVERLRLQYNGNVGIGTTSPSARLEVQGTNSNTQAALKVTDSGDSFFEVVPDNNTTFRIGDLDGVADEAMIVGTFSDITFSAGGTTTMILDSNNRVGIGTTSPSEKLEVDGNVKADNYINQRVAWNVGFLANSVNTSSYYYIPVGYISETTSNQYYNNWVASYAGRVRKIVMRNLGSGTTPTATTVNFRVSVNGSVVYTGSTITVTGSGLNILASQTLSDTNAVFSATDRVQVAYRTNGLWQNAATSISLEYTE